MRFDLTRFWYRSSLHFITLLLPVSWLFYCVIHVRLLLYQLKFIKTHHFPVPVIVVGNISVGGTGKTPLVIVLAHFLKAQGYQPGIVSRGVGGIRHKKPHAVSLVDSALKVGDEALLLLKESACPVVICVDRVAAVDYLLQKHACTIVLSDDGLQHYRLARDIEIAVVDAERNYGNSFLLPAGPLREPISRLKSVDFIVINGDKTAPYYMYVEPIKFIAVSDEQKECDLTAFLSQKIHAVAAIGHPKRFFNMLESHRIDIIAHSFPDHYHFQAQDLQFIEDFPIVMTAKDAMKCRSFARENVWYLKINVQLNEQFQNDLLQQLRFTS